MKKRFLIASLLAALLVTGLSGCKKSSDADVSAAGSVSEPAVVITDISVGDAQTHAAVYPVSFGDGEVVENLYYRRVADKSGVPCYEVKTSPDAEEYVLLPLTDTVIYTDPDRTDCYYETVKLEYKQDGEPATSLQYQLYISTYAISAEDALIGAPAPNEAPDVGGVAGDVVPDVD